MDTEVVKYMSKINVITQERRMCQIALNMLIMKGCYFEECTFKTCLTYLTLLLFPV